MFTIELGIFIIFGILCILSIILAALCTGNDQKHDKKHDKNYQEYVESIKVGDTFGHNSFKCSDEDDPFSENYGGHGFDPYYCVTILDIKKNHKGETWVKYCFIRVLNEQHCTWTDEINEFLKYRTRISRRIDNINTNE